MPSPYGYLATRLDNEWIQLAASPSVVRILAGWAKVEPVLGGYADLEHLRLAVQNRDDIEHGDKLLSALVRLAAVTGHDDMLATRVVLQFLIPGAVRLGNTLAALLGDRATSEALVFSELSVRIRTYPWQRRPRRIAANLMLDCRQHLTRAHSRTHLEITVGLEPTDSARTAPAVDTDMRIALADLLDWARRHRVLSTFEERLLLASYIADVPMETIAAATGHSRSHLFRIRAQAEHRLRKAADPRSWRT